MRALTKKVLGIIHCIVFGPWWIVNVQCRHPKHFTCALGIISRNDRRVEVVKIAVVKILVDGECNRMAEAENGTHRVGPHAELSVFPQELHRLALRLEGILTQVSRAVNFDLFSDNLDGLTATLALRKCSGYPNGCVKSDGAHGLFIKFISIYDHL